MHSKDEPTENTSANEVGETPTPTTPQLRREAMWITGERQRGAMVAALCSLAGVGLGFGLGQMAANDSCRHSLRIEHVQTRAPNQASAMLCTLAAPVAKMTWLGVQGHSVQASCSQKDLQEGARITRVFPGSPAHSAGLQKGDLITGVEGAPVMSFPDLIAAIRGHEKGERVSIEFIDTSKTNRQSHTILSDIARSRLPHP